MDVKFPEGDHWHMTAEQKSTLQIRVAERMKLLGLDQSETARRTRLGISFVRDILRGKSKSPAAANLAKLATALQTTTAYLLR
jgi:transcriptional regulator with XRE-family HTH domain